MSTNTALDNVVIFLVHNTPGDLTITKMMKLVFLADVEHAQLYGVPLCDLKWTWYDFGAFSPVVYSAVEALDEQGMIADVLKHESRHIVPAHEEPEGLTEVFSPRQIRVLTRIIQKYGDMSLTQLKATAYESETMKRSNPDMSLDVQYEPRTGTARASRRVAELRARAPEPNREEWGDPEASAIEDELILKEFASLRDEANRDLY